MIFCNDACIMKIEFYYVIITAKCSISRWEPCLIQSLRYSWWVITYLIKIYISILTCYMYDQSDIQLWDYKRIIKFSFYIQIEHSILLEWNPWWTLYKCPTISFISMACDYFVISRILYIYIYMKRSY